MIIKKSFCIVFLTGGLGLLSCQNSTRMIATPIPTKKMAKVTGKPFLDLKRGHGVYMRQCAQCHEHRLPNTVTVPAWHDKVDSMSALAGLSKKERADLQSYLSEFSDR